MGDEVVYGNVVSRLACVVVGCVKQLVTKENNNKLDALLKPSIKSCWQTLNNFVESIKLEIKKMYVPFIFRNMLRKFFGNFECDIGKK